MKHGIQQLLQLSDMMPPTRGHDLKLPALRGFLKMQGCPPHGGTT